MKKLLACVLCLILLCGCGANNVNGDKLNIVTTVFPVYDFVRAVAGDTASIKLLIKAGSEVHAFEPTPSDMVAIGGCDLFAFIGGESDSWVDSIIADTAVNSIALMESVQTLKEEHSHSTGHLHHHTHDEHIWTSPENTVDMINAICGELCAISPKNAEKYRENAKRYIEEIDAATKEISDAVSNSAEQFIVVADRFPFKYFTDYFGIEYAAALDGCAAASDVSIKTVAELLSVIEKRQVNAVYCTELSNRVIADAIAEQTGVEIIELHSAHNVTLEDFTKGITYVDILLRNKEAIRKGIK